MWLEWTQHILIRIGELGPEVPESSSVTESVLTISHLLNISSWRATELSIVGQQETFNKRSLSLTSKSLESSRVNDIKCFKSFIIVQEWNGLKPATQEMSVDHWTIWIFRSYLIFLDLDITFKFFASNKANLSSNQTAKPPKQNMWSTYLVCTTTVISSQEVLF